MARVLAEEASAGRLHAAAVALSDRAADPALGLPVTVCRGSRLRFLLAARSALGRSTHAIYDFAGMGRAHHLPWPSAVPYACWMHGIEVWEQARRDYLGVLGRAARRWSNSRYTLARAARGHPALDRADLCWLATESDNDAPALGGSRPNHVLIVGRIDAADRSEWPRYKGHDELIRCWPEVNRHVPDARLIVVGDGPGRRQVEALIAASPARAAIELRGFVSEADLDRAFATTRVFAMPSRGEGFGLVYAEAMRHGLPIVASVHDAATEINLDGITGFNVDLTRPGDLAQRLVALLTDRDRAGAMGDAGRRRWREHFRYRAFRTRFLSLTESWWRSTGASMRSPSGELSLVR
jgi:phosphatidylinositol alpha-1,6-mannosyltransferase